MLIPNRRHRLWGVGVVVAGVVVVLVSVSALGADADQGRAGHSRPRGRHSRPAARHPRAPVLASAAGSSSVHARVPSAVVSVPARGARVSVPRSFLGVSTEYWTIPF